MDRYTYLHTVVQTIDPNFLVEIGTWNGQRACRFADDILFSSRGELKTARKPFTYWGFDLFEEASDETDHRELNVKQHFSEYDVRLLLDRKRRQTKGRFSYELYKGDTRMTLKGVDISADLAFIDGGHSLDTIENDYKAVRKSTAVIFDDYYIEDGQGRRPDINIYGCNLLVEELDRNPGYSVHWLAGEGPVAGGGVVKMVMVTAAG